ncbi:hypothetical protein CVIRNUC_011163 [Coccomyxa viridis]|uniref:SAP domain-containing protein n=1 Tax=Coccomyxa viridis TaxID=1274662 RepID=A0AAV1IMS4_9CHLO|nr:hypothetical protein CVIRNUC_011163 [Coccomyxa viridis]
MDQQAVSDVVKHLMLKDLRIQCRARGITPAGGREALLERLNAHMLDTGDFSLRDEGSAPQPQDAQDGNEFAPVGEAPYGNNYGRPEGQNVGNFLTDRPSSRVLAAPGGASQIIFGDGAPAAAKVAPAAAKAAPAVAKENAVQNAVTVDATGGANSLYMGDKQEGKAGHNNYGRPEGQNVGNFLTNRNSSRVLAPPGGLSQISFG